MLLQYFGYLKALKKVLLHTRVRNDESINRLIGDPN